MGLEEEIKFEFLTNLYTELARILSGYPEKNIEKLCESLEPEALAIKDINNKINAHPCLKPDDLNDLKEELIDKFTKGLKL